MPRRVVAAHARQVTIEFVPSTDAAPPPPFFLVELRVAIGVPTDLMRMHDDLLLAMARLREGGVQIDCVGSFFLPEDGRCLCLARAADKSTVALACDAAGLTAAPVYETHHLAPPSAQHSPPEEGLGHRWSAATP